MPVMSGTHSCISSMLVLYYPGGDTEEGQVHQQSWGMPVTGGLHACRLLLLI